MLGSRVPLAWRNLTANPWRLFISISGVTFSVYLMFMQLGFRNAMLDSSIEFIRLLDGDLFLVSSTKYRMFTADQIPRRRLYQVLAIPDVISARPLYMEQDRSMWKNPFDRSTHVIRVMAFDPDQPVFLIPEITSHLETLKLPDTVLVDSKCRSFVGRASPGTRTELARRTVRVIGTFPLGTDFTVDGNVVMSDRNYLKLFPELDTTLPRLRRVEIGVIKLKPGSDVIAAKAAISSQLPSDVKAFTKREFMEFEQGYWKEVSPVGTVFAVGALVGFVVGLVICYQVLFTDLSDQLPQFGTLKAIGYGNRYFERVVLTHALYLSLMSFLLGWVLSYASYWIITRLTGLVMRMNTMLTVLMLVLTVFMCTIAGGLATRKVVSADPAEVF